MTTFYLQWGDYLLGLESQQPTSMLCITINYPSLPDPKHTTSVFGGGKYVTESIHSFEMFKTVAYLHYI